VSNEKGQVPLQTSAEFVRTYDAQAHERAFQARTHQSATGVQLDRREARRKAPTSNTEPDTAWWSVSGWPGANGHGN